jgi:3-phenylpropionate/trans-cinnamate dioxygenase ferredoxin subunit
MAWQRAASVADVKADQGLPVKVGDKTLAIYRVGDNVYALEDVCPHADALLSNGFIDGDKVECPLHQAQFHIPSGKCLGPPADRDLVSFPARIEGNDILVDVG